MNSFLSRLLFLLLLAASFLTGCASTPHDADDDARYENRKPAEVDRVGNTPRSLLSYYQSLTFFSPNELLQEKKRLLQSGNSPDTQLRLAMVLGHPLQPNAELRRAAALLADLLQARDSVSYYLYPIIQILADSYNERLRLERQTARQNAQLEKQYMRLLESQRHAAELQEALEGLANIERALPRTRNR
ncbi:MAG: hypothetical protein FWG81_00435 [Betaproteobacteria bacterium]|nr:hypothetical protein [Betaproteobacteria bacterium]